MAQRHGNPKGESGFQITSSALYLSQIRRLHDKLGALMPYSIPLFRRLQFHLNHPHLVSETAQVFVAVATDRSDLIRGGDDNNDNDIDIDIDEWLDLRPPTPSVPTSTSTPTTTSTTSAKTTSASPSNSDSVSDSRPWIAAHIDLANPGQTQCWVFASWETEGPGVDQGTNAIANELQVNDNDNDNNNNENDNNDNNNQSQHQALMTALFRYIYHDLVGLMPTEPAEDWLLLQRTGKLLSLPYSRNKVLFATVHGCLMPWFQTRARTRIDTGYFKYIFAIDNDDNNNSNKDNKEDKSYSNNDEIDDSIQILLNSKSTTSTSTPTQYKTRSLPPGYHFGPLQQTHLQTVLDRSVIPRTLTTLRQMDSLGVFYTPVRTGLRSGDGGDGGDGDDMTGSSAPVAWGFVGKDASFSSLHTEPEHRGKGLAASLGRELLRRSAWGGGGVGGSRAQELEQDRTKGASPTVQPLLSPLPSLPSPPTLSAPSAPSLQSSSLLSSSSNPNPNPNPHLHPNPISKLNLNWAHADVSVSNLPSQRVMEKLGGRPTWKVAWVEVNLAILLDEET